MWQGKVFQRFATTGAGGEWQVFHCYIPDAYNITHRTNTQESSLITQQAFNRHHKESILGYQNTLQTKLQCCLHFARWCCINRTKCGLGHWPWSTQFFTTFLLFTRTRIYPNHTCLFNRYVLVSSSSPRCHQWIVLHHWAEVDLKCTKDIYILFQGSRLEDKIKKLSCWSGEMSIQYLC